MTAYYSEHDPFAAAWLIELIAEGLIAPGVVDSRSIEDVTPDDLRGFTQVHLFAGIGGWSLALRLAGWPDDRPVWTGFCPCQPFSSAGKGGGFDDERHLWPAMHWLVEQCRPFTIVGEQVASKDGLAWLDLVQADLEGTGYAVGAVDTCAAGFGAPHIRQRLYWLADSDSSGTRAIARNNREISEETIRNVRSNDRTTIPDRDRPTSRMDDPERPGLEGQSRDGDNRHEPGRLDALADGHATETSRTGRLADAPDERYERLGGTRRRRDGLSDRSDTDSDGRPGPTNGLWRSADWLFCRDEKWRAVSPGSFPLADAGSVVNRVGKLRGAGNAINLAQAIGFIEAVIGMEAAL